MWAAEVSGTSLAPMDMSAGDLGMSAGYGRNLNGPEHGHRGPGRLSLDGPEHGVQVTDTGTDVSGPALMDLEDTEVRVSGMASIDPG